MPHQARLADAGTAGGGSRSHGV